MLLQKLRYFATGMRNKLSRHIVTLIFLLTFFQQIGAGLFVHNLLHDSSETKQVPFKNESKKEINFACSCVDDFLVPFVNTVEEPALPVPAIYSGFIDVYTERTYFTSLYFSSLRGPPALIG